MLDRNKRIPTLSWSKVFFLLPLFLWPLAQPTCFAQEWNANAILGCLRTYCSPSEDLVLIAAHRGQINFSRRSADDSGPPENSLESIQKAIDDHIEMVELDTYTTAGVQAPNTQPKPPTAYLMHDSTTYRTVQKGSRYELSSIGIPNRDNLNPIDTNELLDTTLCAGRGKLDVRYKNYFLFHGKVCDTSWPLAPINYNQARHAPDLQNDLFTWLQGDTSWGGVVILDIRDAQTLFYALTEYFTINKVSGGALTNRVIMKFWPDKCTNYTYGSDLYGEQAAMQILNSARRELGLSPGDAVSTVNLMLTFTADYALNNSRIQPNFSEQMMYAYANDQISNNFVLLSPVASVKARWSDSNAMFNGDSKDPVFRLLQDGGFTWQSGSFVQHDNAPGMFSPTWECFADNRSWAGAIFQHHFNGQWADNGRCYGPQISDRKISSDKRDYRGDWANINKLGYRFVIVDDGDGFARYMAKQGKRNVARIRK